MQSNTKGPSTIDEYIQGCEPNIQTILQEIRTVIQKAAPQASEKISYAMPTFFLNGNLVHFAAFKNHIGLYPTPSGIAKFDNEIQKYVHAKGSLQFPLSEPMPLDLIRRIVEFRVAENLAKPKKTA